VQRDLDALAGRPLASHQVIVELIGTTTTQTGVRVCAELDQGTYPLGVRGRDEQLAAVPLVRHGFHGEGNYRMQPAADTPSPTPRSSSTNLEAWR
jgi:Rhodopirellula transposase DDE domain